MKRKVPQPVDVYVGGRLRLARLQREISQTTAGKAIGVTFQQIQKNERGTNRVGASRLAQFAAFYGVPVAWFFEGAPMPTFKNGKATAQPLPDMVALSPAVHELAQVFEAIHDPNHRRTVMDVARALAH